MVFAEALRNAVTQIDGALGCALMGLDGIPLETCFHDRLHSQDEVSATFARYSNVLKAAMHGEAWEESGALQEMCVGTGKSMTLMRVVNADYFLAFAVRPDANLGKARFLLRMMAPEIRELL